jgi:hypothetical protein
MATIQKISVFVAAAMMVCVANVILW